MNTGAVKSVGVRKEAVGHLLQPGPRGVVVYDNVRVQIVATGGKTANTTEYIVAGSYSCRLALYI